MYTKDDNKKMRIARAFYNLTKERRRNQNFSMDYTFGPRCYYNRKDCESKDHCQYGVFCKLKIKEEKGKNNLQ